MKQCPQCNATFTDDNSFCQIDGTTLVLAGNMNQSFSNPTGNNEVPTQYISTPNRIVEKPASSGIPGWMYMLVGIMGTALIGLVAFILLMPKAENKTNASVEKNNQSEITKSAKVEEEPTKEIKVNSKPEFKTPVPSQPTATQSALNEPNFTSPGGNWTGDWSSKNTSYTATISLQETENGIVEGKIDWNLTKTSNPKKVNKVGSSATEYVKGTYNYQTGKLFLRGYSKDDPSDIIILDKYNLSMSKDGQQISGKSINGNFVLRR